MPTPSMQESTRLLLMAQVTIEHSREVGQGQIYDGPAESVLVRAEAHVGV